MRSEKLNDKTVFITGASSGIGEATAKAFADKGAKLLLCARNIEKLEKFKTQLQEENKIDIFTFQLDVRDKLQVSKTIDSLPDDWKKIDILVNNAGLAAGKDKAQDALLEDWEQMIDTNVKGLLFVTKKVIPGMIERKVGHVINIGSLAGQESYAGGSVYCATKAAVRSFSRALKMDLTGTEIRVTSIDPGLVETDFSMVRFKGDTKKAKEVYQGMTPLTAEDVAECVFFAANRPKHLNISEMLLLPTDQGSSTLVHRRTA